MKNQIVRIVIENVKCENCLKIGCDRVECSGYKPDAVSDVDALLIEMGCKVLYVDNITDSEKPKTSDETKKKKIEWKYL
jgi:hypothetical protein